MARHDHRLASELGGDVVAGLRDLAGVPYEQPGAAEDALHLELEDIRIRVHAAMNPARLDQLGDFVRISVAHGIPLNSISSSCLVLEVPRERPGKASPSRIIALVSTGPCAGINAGRRT
jgi:hypothetical protein